MGLKEKFIFQKSDFFLYKTPDQPPWRPNIYQYGPYIGPQEAPMEVCARSTSLTGLSPSASPVQSPAALSSPTIPRRAATRSEIRVASSGV